MAKNNEERLFQLRLKLNAGRKANKEKVAQEHEGTELSIQEIAKDKTDKYYLSQTVAEASVCKKKRKVKDKHKASFGWDVFNQDALYNAYKKRQKHLSGEQVISAQDDAAFVYGRNDGVHEKGVESMVAELGERANARKKFSRRRQHYEDKDVDYINDRNLHFNKKIARAFDKYTVEIRQNIERGTAL